MVTTGVVTVFGRQLIIGRVLLVLAFAAAGVIASPVSPAAADDGGWRSDIPGFARTLPAVETGVPEPTDRDALRGVSGVLGVDREALCRQMSVFGLTARPAAERAPAMVTLHPAAGRADCDTIARSLLAEFLGTPAAIYDDVHATILPALAARVRSAR